MSNAERLDALVGNMTKQWSEDAAKRSSITDTQRYNQLVSAANGMNSAGIFDPALTVQQVMDYFTGIWTSNGFAGVEAVYEAQRDVWENLEDWPVTFA